MRATPRYLRPLDSRGISPPPMVCDSVRTIAVLRALHLGDLLCAVPALRALRDRHPDARITLIGLPWAHEMVRRYPAYLDQLLPFPGFPGMPEAPVDLRALAAFIASGGEGRFDLAVQLHGNGARSNIFLSLLGASRLAGSHPPGGWRPAGAFVPYAEDEPEIRRLLTVVGALGARTDDERLEFPLADADRDQLAAALGRGALAPGMYACLHPGARDPDRRWQPDRFAAVGDALEALGLRVVITGTAAERSLAPLVSRTMRHAPLDLTGRLTLGALGALMADAAVTVCNNTGVAHLAHAVDASVVVAYLGPERRRWELPEGPRRRSIASPATRRQPAGDVPAWTVRDAATELAKTVTAVA